MILEIDKEVGATYVRLTKEKVHTTKSQGEYIIDFAKDGSIIGIEYLNIPKIEIDEQQIKV